MANTHECVAMLLRPGNAAANDVADHKTVLAAALRQIPLPLWSKLLIRIDGAAFSHALLDHLTALTTTRRRVRWVTGWAIHTADEAAIARLPERGVDGRAAAGRRGPRDHRARRRARSPTRSPS